MYILFYSQNIFAKTSILDFTINTDYTFSNTNSFYFSWTNINLNFNYLDNEWSKIINSNYKYDIVINWNYAYMSSISDDRINVLDISNKTNIYLVRDIVNNWTSIKLDEPRWLLIDWNYLYVASHSSDALQIFNITDPSNPVAVWNISNSTTLNWATWLKKVWIYIIMTCDIYDSISVINVSNPASPRIMRNLRNTTKLDWARDIEIKWNYAFVSAYNWDSFTVIDISHITSPKIKTSLKDTINLNWAYDIEIKWNYAYISAYLNNSVRIINITNPLSLSAVWNIAYTFNWPKGLLIDNDNLFISINNDENNNNDAIKLFNIKNQISPVYITEIIWEYDEDYLRENDILIISPNFFKKVWDFIYTTWRWVIDIIKLNYDITSPYIINNNAISYWSSNITYINENLWSSNQWYLTYQISKDNWSTWYYWNSNQWIQTNGWVSYTNSISVINTNLVSFNALSWWNWLFKVKIFFHSDWSKKVELDSIFISTDEFMNIISTSVWNNKILAWWNNQSINIYYIYDDDYDHGAINSIKLYKWIWSSWSSDISSTAISSWYNISQWEISYKTNNLTFWKYKYEYWLTNTDDLQNSAFTSAIFYVDEPELILDKWNLDIWTIDSISNKFSPELTIYVKTIWAAFDLLLNQDSPLSYNTFQIENWDWIKWFWYDKEIYTNNINYINTNQIIKSEAKNININWDKNTYIYKLKFWAKKSWSPEQAAWNYISNIKIWIDLDY